MNANYHAYNDGLRNKSPKRSDENYLIWFGRGQDVYAKKQGKKLDADVLRDYESWKSSESAQQ